MNLPTKDRIKEDRSVDLPAKSEIKELDYGVEVEKNDSVPELTKKEPVHICERFTKADDKENKNEEVNFILFFKILISIFT